MKGPAAGVIYLTGPTAVGKSAVALWLAGRLGGEIISVDSMQVYRGMDIGTAKPSLQERARIPHHLLDVCDVRETFNAARFVELASAAVQEIRARGRRPIFCGGTGLYLKAWRHGLSELPEPRPDLRQELEATPLAALLAELRQRDPVAYARIDRRNLRRVVRAVEVIRLTGRPFSAQQADWQESDPADQSGIWVALRREPADLRARIEARVDAMFSAGLVEETRRLLEAGLGENRTALQALGYRQVVEHLQGRRDLPATVALVKTRTWQFARRQMNWLRHQLPVQWLDWPPAASVAEVGEAILRRLEQGAG